MTVEKVWKNRPTLCGIMIAWISEKDGIRGAEPSFCVGYHYWRMGGGEDGERVCEKILQVNDMEDVQGWPDLKK